MALKEGGIVILDYGSQTAQLIARRVRELNVFAALVPYTLTLEEARQAAPDFRGIILSGGPSSVYEAGAPPLPAWVLESGVPVLGICYGMQLITQRLGGEVAGTEQREFGLATVRIERAEGLFDGLTRRRRSDEPWGPHRAPAGKIHRAGRDRQRPPCRHRGPGARPVRRPVPP